MHAVEITNYLDERITELARNRLPDEPGYPSGDSQYASFMTAGDDMNKFEKNSEKSRDNSSYRSSNGYRNSGDWSDESKSQDKQESHKKKSESGNKQKNSFSESDAKDTKSMKRDKNGLPPFLSPTLPPAFEKDEHTIIPSPLSPTLPGEFQPTAKISEKSTTSANTTPNGQKRKREDLPSDKDKSNDLPPAKASRKSPPPSITTTPASAKKSVSLNEYKKRKNNVGTSSSPGPLTPTLQKILPSDVTDSPRQLAKDNSESPSYAVTKPKDDLQEAKAFAEKSQKSLAQGTALKREADKLSRSDPITAAVIATRAILYFISAFACDDQARKLRGKLALHENWKSTSEFIVWVINHQKDKNEPELEGLCHQLHAICHQRLFESEQRFLRVAQKQFRDKDQIDTDDPFWKLWNESNSHYHAIAKAWRQGQSKLSEQVLREKFPTTWKAREYWGSEVKSEEEGRFGSKYRLPLGMGSTVSEAIGFAVSILQEFVVQRGIKYSMSDL